MKAKIGYFIPQFPGQTHIFFWRERQFLAELGIETDLVSTQLPPRAIVSHVWAEEAKKNTVYLLPFGAKDFINSFVEVLKAGPAAWWQCLAVIAKARDTSLSQKVGLLALVFVAGKLAGLTKTKGWSHIHVHSCANTASIALFNSILTGCTYSMTLHGPTLEVYGPNQEQKWKNAAFAIVISQLLLNDVKNKLANFLPTQLAVAPMGVNIAEIKRSSPYKPWQEGSPCKIFACGRLNPVKGHKYLIETVELLRNRGFDVRLQIAGEDEEGGSGYHKELEKIIEDKSMSECVELLGAVSEQRIRQGLEEANVFALASLNEGVPVAVMEAMAMEVPTVVTNVGGTSELVDDGADAVLVQSEKPEEMADAIAQVLQNPELALRLSQESRKKIIAKFSHGRSAETLAKCLEKLGITNPS
ncbi:exopolysaccharide biosynthesis GT4 family glycosyltransferase EpsE [Microcoleus sp. herbarium2]|uniref:exopolysaccharide biosynthesis GT4 family glycosyltransferase EpsE n=1 Tax=Microcoleus sp. herbarium2 TaxID=3055433 RepID=UPI002FD1F707